MEILFQPERRLFHLRSSEVSYAFRVARDGKLVHLYWGGRLNDTESLAQLAEAYGQPLEASGGVDRGGERRLELRTQEPYNFGEPTLDALFADGVRGARLVYDSHSVSGDQLFVALRDERYPLVVTLRYQTYGDLPLISRSVTVTNVGEERVLLVNPGSATWYLPRATPFRLTHLAGNWGSEYGVERVMLTQSQTVLQNTRLTCAAAQQTPFFALDEGGMATETAGEVYYGVLHWSGDFRVCVETEYGRMTSVSGGVNPQTAQWPLAPGASFDAPLFTAGFSARGFERMSEALYDWQYDYLLPRGKRTDKARAVRPIICNSWYPYEFDVREDNLLSFIDRAAEIGAELFVVDDGWMPKRTDDRAGLGDWVADPARFPRGFAPIARRCHEKGLLFGLWVEPEMVNADSDLYRAHPDWVVRQEGRPLHEQRRQLILNLARDDVRDWMISWLDRLIEDAQLDYLKWDMNRYVTECGWPEATEDERLGMNIRYTQNLMRVWRHLNERYPDLLLENCASGGGRADFGMVPYADRINRSDNADPVDVMLLHEGFTMLFVPKTAGGAGNIAPAAHGVHGRETPLSFRVHWGMTGSMSVGVDLLTCDETTLARLREATDAFKRVRADLQDAYVYRIASARERPYAAFQYVRRDRRAFTLFAFAHGMRNWDKNLPALRMRGLLADARYRDGSGRVFSGETLMNIGVTLDMKGDCDSRMLVFSAEG